MPNSTITTLPIPWPTQRRWLLLLACLVTAASLAAFLILTRHWPLIGDAVSVHYLLFLMQHGMAPYRQIVDAQMPGTYLYDGLALHIFGGSAPGLRLFDITLLAGAMAAMLAIVWPDSKTTAAGQGAAAFIAAGVFALVHGRDGIAQAAQRDLVMTVLLLAACASAFHAARRHTSWLAAIAGSCASAAVCIKPTLLPAFAALFYFTLREPSLSRDERRRHAGAICLGALLPLLAAAAFLVRNHAVVAFIHAARVLLPYHASLQKRPLAFLLAHSFSPLAVALVPWLAALAWRRFYRPAAAASAPCALARSEMTALYAVFWLSLADYVVQAKGFPYQRYPFIALLLLLAMLECARALHAAVASPVLRAAGALGIAGAALFLAPASVLRISRIPWRGDDFRTLLTSDLNAIGGPGLSGNVQCLDAFAGCVETLYQMKLIQSTGFLVDFYFYAPPGAATAIDPAVVDLRQQFFKQLDAAPPRVFIVTDEVFPAYSHAGHTFEKLQRWPRLKACLDQKYVLSRQRAVAAEIRWPRDPQATASYRIYLRKP